MYQIFNHPLIVYTYACMHVYMRTCMYACVYVHIIPVFGLLGFHTRRRHAWNGKKAEALFEQKC
jgi:hypothetical protein